MLNSIMQIWNKLYNDAGRNAQTANSDALRKHFEAEQRQIKLTLDAMDIQDPSIDSGGDIDSPNAGWTGQQKTASPGPVPVVVPAPIVPAMPVMAEDSNTIGPGGPAPVTPSNTPVTPTANAQPSDALGGSTLGPGLPAAGENYRKAIETAAGKSGVPANLLAGLIHDESRWDPGAGTVNGGNGMSDSGLVQMNTATFGDLQTRHADLIGKDKNDPATNILAGAYYLAEMKDEMKKKFGKDDWGIALRAYNSGPNGVDPNNLSNLPAGTGTTNYVDKIMGYANTIKNGGTLPA